MSNHYYNDMLYPLQDRVLKQIAISKTPFYLTGGTVLGRFLLDHRYSDDLDFFLNAAADFKEQIEKLIDFLSHTFKDIRKNNLQDSFARYYIVEGELQLKVEFVNDVGFRAGIPTQNEFGLQCDTWDNILSNKLTALSRTAPKDYADVLFLCLKYKFNWKIIIDYAKRKDSWINEINISQQLMNFDLEKLKEVKFIEGFDLKKITKEYFQRLARESLHGFDNSLYGYILH